MARAVILAIYGFGVVLAWGVIVALVRKGSEPMPYGEAWAPAAAYALAWPVLGACALLVMTVGRLRS
jgi:hypothetical protein